MKIRLYNGYENTNIDRLNYEFSIKHCNTCHHYKQKNGLTTFECTIKDECDYTLSKVKSIQLNF